MVADHHLYTASACAAGTSCRTLNITCGSGTRIQIVSGFYGKRTTSAASIGSRPDCKGACLHDGECCAYTPGDGNKTVSRSDLRELKEQCSWMPDCSPGVPYKRDYLYATIFYYCTPGTIPISYFVKKCILYNKKTIIVEIVCIAIHVFRLSEAPQIL